MVFPTPIYAECRLGRGMIEIGSQGCVVDPWEDALGDLFPPKMCDCLRTGTCRLDKDEEAD